MKNKKLSKVTAGESQRQKLFEGESGNRKGFLNQAI